MSDDSSNQDLHDLEARIKNLEGVASEYQLAIALQEQLRRERRYALLQAAATILAGGVFMRDGDNEPQNWESSETAIFHAEELLAEIEKREKAEAES